MNPTTEQVKEGIAKTLFQSGSPLRESNIVAGIAAEVDNARKTLPEGLMDRALSQLKFPQKDPLFTPDQLAALAQDGPF